MPSLENWDSAGLNSLPDYCFVIMLIIRFWDCVDNENSILNTKDHLYYNEDTVVADISYNNQNGEHTSTHTCIHVHVHVPLTSNVMNQFSMNITCACNYECVIEACMVLHMIS